MVMKYIKEPIVCFILGGVPCLWAFSDKGIKGVESLAKSIDTSEPTVGYFLFLASLQFILSMLSWLAPRVLENVKTFFRFIHPITNGVGSSLLCLYRIMAGVCIGCVAIILSNYSQVGNLEDLAVFSVTGTVFILMSYFVNKTFEFAITKQQVGL